jgi:general stress protein 26
MNSDSPFDPTNPALADDESFARLWDLIKDCHFGMLVTSDGEGALHGRPMTTVQKHFGGTLWFVVPTISDVVRDIAYNDNCCVTYARTSMSDFVSVSGTGSVLIENAIKEKLWNPMLQAWFPQGPTSRSVAVLKVDAQQADYWDSKSNKLVQLFSMASAYLTGRTPTNIGEHRHLNM